MKIKPQLPKTKLKPIKDIESYSKRILRADSPTPDRSGPRKRFNPNLKPKRKKY